MRTRLATCALTAVLGLGFAASAQAVIGPTQQPLKVVSMYTLGNNGAIYVSFNQGAMPGCYSNSGGYLWASNSFFKEIYAQLLTMTATGGIKASVLYTQRPQTNNWDDCYIDGIYLMPE